MANYNDIELDVPINNVSKIITKICNELSDVGYFEDESKIIKDESVILNRFSKTF